MTSSSPIEYIENHSGVLVDDIGAYVTFVARISDVVMVSPATRWDPEEWGSADCMGTIYLEDDQHPETDEEFRALAENVDEWTPMLD